MLYRFVAFALGKFQVGDRHVILEINEMLVAFIVFAGGRRKPKRLQRLLHVFLRLGQFDPGCFAFPLRNGLARRRGLGNDVSQPKGAIGGTNCGDRILMPVRPEGLQAVVKFDLAAVVAPEMKCGIKPA